MSATRQRYRCHRFGTLLRWGIRFLSGIRIRCFDYSRVTRVRVLLTFYPTSLRYLLILASLRVTQCDSLLLAYPHVLLTCGPFIEFFKNTKNLFIHIALIPIGDSPRDIPTF